jgi:hypothetical protein
MNLKTRWPPPHRTLITIFINPLASINLGDVDRRAAIEKEDRPLSVLETTEH